MSVNGSRCGIAKHLAQQEAASELSDKQLRRELFAVAAKAASCGPSPLPAGRAGGGGGCRARAALRKGQEESAARRPMRGPLRGQGGGSVAREKPASGSWKAAPVRCGGGQEADASKGVLR